MDESLMLSRAFLGCAPRSCQGAASHQMEATLRARWEQGRAAWPAIALAAETFAAHLGACLEEKDEPERFLVVVRADEVYLTCACAQGVPAAIAAFDREFLQKVASMLGRIDPSPTLADEVRQVLRERLLVGHAGDKPKIAQFSGHGALLGWLRIAAVRTAHNTLRSAYRPATQQVEDLPANELPVGPGLERDYLKARYQPEFKEALRTAFAALPEEQRDILRWQFIGGLSGEEIAKRLGVVRRTVVRRLAEAREALFKQTRQQMRQRLRVSDSEFESLMGVVRSGLDLSISMFLVD